MTHTTSALRRQARWRPTAAAAGLLAALHAGAWAQCDLKAEFINTAVTTLPGGEPATWTLRFSNIAVAGGCAAKQVRLNRHVGSTASGSASWVGGTGYWVELPALAAGNTANLTFLETATPPSGVHTYKLAYSSPHNDADNFNHHPTRTVTFQPGATVALPPDLTIVSVQPMSPGVRIGSCNVLRVRVSNLGGNLVGLSQLRLRVYRPGLPGNVADTKSVQIGDQLPKQSRDVEVRGVHVPQPGPWRFEAVADATGTITESNEANNSATMDFANVVQLCPP